MNSVTASSERPDAPLFSDGLGERVVAADGATGELLQILRLRPALTAVPSFEFALRERAARLANFRHAYYARVRRIDRVAGPPSSLALVSDHIEGTRLSDLLRVAEEKRLQLDINAALYLIRQLVPGVALLHENAREVAHGLIAPERLLITPHGRLIIVEHVLAAAIEQLQFGREQLWQEFRVAMPPSAGIPRFDHRADVTGIGLVALALVLGRPLRADEFPHRIPALLNEGRERTALGNEQPLSPALRSWLARALQLDLRRAFASAPEALTALEDVVGDDSAYVAAPVALETFLSRYTASLLEEQAEEPVQPTHVAAPAPIAAPLPVASASVPPPEPTFVAPVAPAPPIAAPFVAPVADSIGVSAPEPLVAAPRVPPPPAPAAAAAGPAVRSASAIVSAPVLTDLIPAADLQTRRDYSSVEPLFNPDAPFTFEPQQNPPEPSRAGTRPWLRTAAILLAVAVVAGGGFYGWRSLQKAPPPAQGGTLLVQSSPSGVQVFIDGVDRGMTPAQLSIPAGAHILELRGRGVPRVIPLTVAAGAQLSQYVEFANTPATGQLAVQSEPAGAKVVVDGTPRGVAPLTVADLAPGSHEVVLQSEGTTVRHVVDVQPGATASLVAPMGAAAPGGPVSGWIAVKAPFSVEVREGGRLLGTSDTDRIMIAAGRHDLELLNDTLGYRSSRSVQVPAGKVATMAVDLPRGVVNLNATPWAEVWIDGERVGETPIGNLSVAIGPHEIVFRNPQLGEKRHAISVTLGAPVRVSVDMRK
jgi:hypothetical protein